MPAIRPDLLGCSLSGSFIRRCRSAIAGRWEMVGSKLARVVYALDTAKVRIHLTYINLYNKERIAD